MKIAAGILVSGFFGLPYLFSDIHLCYSPNSRVEKYIKPITDLHSGFLSTPWINSGLLQSYFGSTSRQLSSDMDQIKHIEYTRKTNKFSDGGTYSIDTYGESSKKILFIVPGLTGGSESAYIKHLVAEGEKRGYQSIVMNGRGINGTPLTTYRTNQLGCSRDIKEIVDEIKKQNPECSIVGIGTSMGANQLLKYAGEQGKDSKIEAFVALGTPFDIVICSRYLRKRSPINSVPDTYLVDNMLKVIKSNEDTLLHSFEELGINIEQVYNAGRSFEFDSVFTCKLLGFKNPEHYYRKASCIKYLHKIERPTLAISSLDDPVVTKDCIPHEEFKSNPYLALAETRRGGHIGWFTEFIPRRWYPKVSMDFLENVLNDKTN